MVRRRKAARVTELLHGVHSFKSEEGPLLKLHCLHASKPPETGVLPLHFKHVSEKPVRWQP